MGVGAIGIIIPFVPSTPLILLSATCFSASNKKIYGFFERNRFIGPFIEDFHTKQGISLGLKIGCIIYLWITLAISMIIMRKTWAYILLTAVGLFVTIHVLRIKTKNKEEIKMCRNQKFYICKHCGNLVGLIDDKGVPLVCCGEPMAELIANTVEASVEKHLPVATMSGNTLTVEVGSVPHPMTEEHHISFIYVETANGGQRKCLNIGAAPVAKFSFADDEPKVVFAYCNLHGLWKTEL